MYQFSYVDRTCTKRPLNGDFQPLEVPKNATLVGHYVLGASSDFGQGVLVNTWAAEVPLTTGKGTVRIIWAARRRKKATWCSTWPAGIFCFVLFFLKPAEPVVLMQQTRDLVFRSGIPGHRQCVRLHSHKQSLLHRANWMVSDQVSASVLPTERPHRWACLGSADLGLFSADGLTVSLFVSHLSASPTASWVWMILQSSSHPLSVRMPSWRRRSRFTSTTCFKNACSGTGWGGTVHLTFSSGQTFVSSHFIKKKQHLNFHKTNNASQHFFAFFFNFLTITFNLSKNTNNKELH